MESFQGLKERYSIVRIVKANLITPRNACPEYITIPEEHLMTKVYEYEERPLQYHKCQKYGHVQKSSVTSYTGGSCAHCSRPSNRSMHFTDQTLRQLLKTTQKTTDAACKIRERCADTRNTEEGKGRERKGENIGLA